jgi:hypothetical protein
VAVTTTVSAGSSARRCNSDRSAEVERKGAKTPRRSAAKPPPKERGIYSASSPDHARIWECFHAAKPSDVEAELIPRSEILAWREDSDELQCREKIGQVNLNAYRVPAVYACWRFGCGFAPWRLCVKNPR